MARGAALFGLASLLLGAVNGQLPGEGEEVHPKITTYRCTKAGGCKAKTNYVVLDALAHPVHQATNQYGCGDWGQKPNATACPDKESCAKNCVMDPVSDYSTYGINTDGDSLRLQQLLNGKLVSPRVYLLDETKRRYEMLSLTGNEFTFDVDATKLPCGMNSALYLSEMKADGAQSTLNPGGAYFGTGYCDAQCYVTPFINGIKGPYLCEGEECQKQGVCDKAGCAWNPYRVNVTDYYGAGEEFKVNSNKLVTVVTQFHANRKGKLESIHRKYVQEGRVIESYVVDAPGLPSTDSMTDELCSVTGADAFMRLGAMQGMGDALTRGMVLALSIWWDEGGNMNWLDAGEAGPCNLDEGHPTEIVKVEPAPEVTFSNMRWGEIDSTYETGQEGKGKGKNGNGKGKGKDCTN
ncbi:concanavalin A-like lectin/glucanase domain-containing protein [Chaetomium tenue]|uniref:Concanavalin A-like lectin/glucanase domain-containing protein n=1 Tax=Chaetomium tenue TaxID=1854479 RepID=A0ACB7NXQ0_9PEZI|nr:concanavalin A-like lectin/glucanase domain-containing protein [Chaetomium globosum]